MIASPGFSPMQTPAVPTAYLRPNGVKFSPSFGQAFPMDSSGAEEPQDSYEKDSYPEDPHKIGRRIAIGVALFALGGIVTSGIDMQQQHHAKASQATCVEQRPGSCQKASDANEPQGQGESPGLRMIYSVIAAATGGAIAFRCRKQPEA